MDGDTKPFDIPDHHSIRFRINPLGIGIFNPEDVFSAVSFYIRIVKNGSSCMPQVQRPAGIRSKPHHDTMVCLFKTGELLYMYFGPGHICGNIRGQGTKLLLPFGR